MAEFLEDAGVVVTVPDGGYFMVADFSNFSKLLLLHSLFAANIE